MGESENGIRVLRNRPATFSTRTVEQGNGRHCETLRIQRVNGRLSSAPTPSFPTKLLRTIVKLKSVDPKQSTYRLNQFTGSARPMRPEKVVQRTLPICGGFSRDSASRHCLLPAKKAAVGDQRFTSIQREIASLPPLTVRESVDQEQIPVSRSMLIGMESIFARHCTENARAEAEGRCGRGRDERPSRYEFSDGTR